MKTMIAAAALLAALIPLSAQAQLQAYPHSPIQPPNLYGPPAAPAPNVYIYNPTPPVIIQQYQIRVPSSQPCIAALGNQC